jgi:hypothetical protein
MPHGRGELPGCYPFFPVKLDPGNMVTHRIGVRLLMAHNDAHNVHS